MATKRGAQPSKTDVKPLNETLIWQRAERGASNRPLQRGRVLLVDDEEEVRKVVGLTLWRLGHVVELAEDGPMAIEVCKKAKSLGRHFDVVVLDLTVRKGMGGQETIQALLKIDPGVKAIAMSRCVENPVILEPERHGFKAALEKPFAIGKLQQLVSRVMGGLPASSAVA